VEKWWPRGRYDEFGRNDCSAIRRSFELDQQRHPLRHETDNMCSLELSLLTHFGHSLGSPRQRDAVHAATQPGGRWPIVKNVSKMTAIPAARHFSARHKNGAILFGFSRIWKWPELVIP
jgi:hypothetical protein